jgi:hypothetical protein
MAYHQSSGKMKRTGSAFGTVITVFILFIIFVFAVQWFRAPKEVSEEPLVNSIANVLTPDPISEAVFKAIDTESKTATLHWMSTGELLGEAERGVKDDHYYFEAKLLLPEIDRDIHYYQVWLIRKLPYDFFSLGEMKTNDDGDFVIEWLATDDEINYFEYTGIIITVNQYEGTSDPIEKRVTGEFGN